MRSLKLLRFKNLNKRGIIIGEVMFILLNIAFFSMALYSIYNKASGPAIKEKVLAKEIVLYINAAEPDSIIELNIEDYKRIAEKNKIKNFIRIENGYVTVILDEKATGFRYPYFSNYKLESKVEGGFLYIKVENE